MKPYKLNNNYNNKIGLKIDTIYLTKPYHTLNTKCEKISQSTYYKILQNSCMIINLLQYAKMFTATPLYRLEIAITCSCVYFNSRWKRNCK